MIPLTAAALAAALSCAPNEDRFIAQSIMVQEASADPNAMLNETTGEQYYSQYTDPTSARIAAYYTAVAWLRQGDIIDIGLTGIRSTNIPRTYQAVWTTLDPCVNVRTSYGLLSTYYKIAKNAGKSDANLEATWYALRMYNGGPRNGKALIPPDSRNLDPAARYASQVLSRAEQLASTASQTYTPFASTGAAGAGTDLPDPDRPWPKGATWVPVVSSTVGSNPFGTAALPQRSSLDLASRVARMRAQAAQPNPTQTDIATAARIRALIDAKRHALNSQPPTTP